jgi:nicotinamide mononucleotide transporter
MVARRVMENWLYWIVVDSVAAYLYYTRGLTATAVLFLVYVGMVIYGYYAWRKTHSIAGEIVGA